MRQAVAVVPTSSPVSSWCAPEGPAQESESNEPQARYLEQRPMNGTLQLSQDLIAIVGNMVHYSGFLPSPYLFYLLTVGVEVVYFHLITLRHTPQSVGVHWMRDRPVAETSTWQHKHSQETNIHSPVGFEPTIPASARLQTYALDRAATGIGNYFGET
jgi:hypothetical protein